MPSRWGLFFAVFCLCKTCSCYFYESTRTVSVFLPKTKTTVLAENIQNDGQSLAVFGDMILGDIITFQVNDSLVEIVKLKGDFNPMKSSNRKLDSIETSNDSRWPNSVISFEISEGFSSAMVNNIRSAAWTWTHNSPARFIENATAPSRIRIVPLEDEDKGCISVLGHEGGVQPMWLNPAGSCGYGRVLHEFGHAIGWHHEHTRPDRDEYITILEENIILGYESSYEMVHEAHYGAHDYDYGSIMHYPERGVSNDRDAIHVVEEKFSDYLERFPNELPRGMGTKIGQRFHLSSLDKQMSFTYLTGCHDDMDYTGTDLSPKWVAAPWGGCVPQCTGLSYRERLVSCQFNGICQPLSACNATEKPATQKSCELAPGNLQVTFDEQNLWEAGSMMQNVAFHDQADWILWSGNPTARTNHGAQFLGTVPGPGTDGSGISTGKYLLFHAYTPVQRGDQAWYESPIVGTAHNESCKVSFNYFIISGTSSKIIVELVSCADCLDKQVLWTGTQATSQWISQSIILPEVTDHKVKLRFIAEAGKSTDGHIGLDNIIFSKGCIRPDMDEALAVSSNTTDGMTYPFENFDLRCIYIPDTFDFFWTTLLIAVVSLASLCCCVTLCGLAEFGIRVKVLKAKLKEKGQALKLGALLRELCGLKLLCIVNLENRFSTVFSASEDPGATGASVSQGSALPISMHKNKSPRASSQSPVITEDGKELEKEIEQFYDIFGGSDEDEDKGPHQEQQRNSFQMSEIKYVKELFSGEERQSEEKSPRFLVGERSEEIPGRRQRFRERSMRRSFSVSIVSNVSEFAEDSGFNMRLQSSQEIFRRMFGVGNEKERDANIKNNDIQEICDNDIEKIDVRLQESIGIEPLSNTSDPKSFTPVYSTKK